MIKFRHSAIAFGKRFIRAVVTLFTWTLAGTTVGLVGAAVFGFLSGLVYAVMCGKLVVIITVMLYTARAGAAAGAITGATAKLFNGDFWPPPDESGQH